MRWSAVDSLFLTCQKLGNHLAVALRLTVRFNTVERGRARLSTVEHGRETVEIRYTAVQRGSFNRTLPRSTAARWDLGIKQDQKP